MPEQPCVLVVDDSHLIRWALCRSLDALGLTVVTASSRQELLERLTGSRYCLVVASSSVAREDVTDLLRIACRRHPEMALILLTARESIPDADAWGERTVMIDKPFSVDDVTAAVMLLVPACSPGCSSCVQPILDEA